MSVQRSDAANVKAFKNNLTRTTLSQHSAATGSFKKIQLLEKDQGADPRWADLGIYKNRITTSKKAQNEPQKRSSVKQFKDNMKAINIKLSQKKIDI